MFTLRALVAVGLVLVLSAGACAADKRGRPRKHPAQTKAHKQSAPPKQARFSTPTAGPSRVSHLGAIMMWPPVKAKPKSGPPAGFMIGEDIPSRRVGPNPAPKSASLAAFQTLSNASRTKVGVNPGSPRPWTDDNGAPSELGLSAKKGRK